MRYFDYAKVARETGIPAGKLARLRRMFHAEFPRDAMLRELHMLRACLAVKKGWITLDQAFAASATAPSRAR